MYEQYKEMTDKDELLVECCHRLHDALHLLRKYDVPWTGREWQITALAIKLGELKTKEQADDQAE